MDGIRLKYKFRTRMRLSDQKISELMNKFPRLIRITGDVDQMTKIK